jgi:uncharacterized protein (DUF427 family)
MAPTRCEARAVARRGEDELRAAGGRGAIAPNGKPVESVWDFPRPPRVERVDWRIRVVHGGAVIVDAPSAIRVLETSQAPAYYVDARHVRTELLRLGRRTTFCEWKGRATYADVVVDGRDTTDACWTYRDPSERFTEIADHWAFYAQSMDECWVDEERVDGNEGSFYGGWVTNNVTGPIKGTPGSTFW